MSSYDAYIQDIFYNYILSFFVFIILMMLYQKQMIKINLIKDLHKYLEQIHDEFMSESKKKLFQDIEHINSASENLRRVDSIRVLIIGYQQGINFKYLPRGTRVFILESDEEIRKQLYKCSFEQFDSIIVEDIIEQNQISNIPDGYFDAIISTFSLCQFENVNQFTKSCCRTLSKSGKFFYVEHILYEENSWILKLQVIASKIWFALFNGCQINRYSHSYFEKCGLTTYSYIMTEIKNKNKFSWFTQPLTNLMLLCVKCVEVGWARK